MMTSYVVSTVVTWTTLTALTTIKPSRSVKMMWSLEEVFLF